jgi:GR25 family glycosyltransferase involved in LPS biosynthesis
MIHVRIISIRNPAPANAAYVERISDKHSKYVRRKKYVDDVLLPLLSKHFEDVQCFDAVTPSDYQMTGGDITYKGVFMKFSGTFPANYLSNYELWKQCAVTNVPMLILEDDALLPETNVETVKKAIDEFIKLEDKNYLLYLLSQHPQNTAMKDYKMSTVVPFNDKFFSIRPIQTLNSDQVFEDIGGTSAYVITPNTAKTLCELAESGIGENTDRFIGRANSYRNITMLFPNNYGKLFLLYEQLSEWNMVHKNNAPPKWDELSPDWKRAFTMNNQIGVHHTYVNDANGGKMENFTHEDIEKFIQCAKDKKTDYGTYGPTDTWLHEALDAVSVEGMSVAVMGSIRPWYESMVIAYGGKPTTIEYNLPGYNHPKIQEILYFDLLKFNHTFDAAVSISSFEHDGLGRYGDPLNPQGDLVAMKAMKRFLKPNGILFLAVPMGQDQLVWNAHRIYGNLRFPLLIQGWEVLGAVGYDPNNLFINMNGGGAYQPVIVLKNI